MYENETVASLRKKKFFSDIYEGSYGDDHIEIKYRQKGDYARFLDVRTDEEVGVLRNIFETTQIGDQFEFIGYFEYKNNEKYSISLQAGVGYIFADKEGKEISKNEFNRYSASVKSSFSLLSEDILMSPWLIALVSHYYAINKSAGWL